MLQDILSNWLGDLLGYYSIPLLTFLVGYIIAAVRRYQSQQAFRHQYRGQNFRNPPESIFNIAPIIGAISLSGTIWATSMFLYTNQTIELPNLFAALGIAALLTINLARELRLQNRISSEVSEMLIHSILKAASDQTMALIKEFYELNPNLRGTSDPLDGVVRCNIMLLDRKRNILSIGKFAHNMDANEDIDRSLSIEHWKGVAGQAANDKKPKFGNCKQRVILSNGRDQWFFNEEDWKLIRHDLSWIISIPLLYRNHKYENGEIFGVFNIDSNISINVKSDDAIEHHPLISNIMLISQSYGRIITLALQNLLEE